MLGKNGGGRPPLNPPLLSLSLPLALYLYIYPPMSVSISVSLVIADATIYNNIISCIEPCFTQTAWSFDHYISLVMRTDIPTSIWLHRRVHYFDYMYSMNSTEDSRRI